MIEPNAITVRCSWREDGALLIWGELGRRVTMDAQTLKNYLFGWHVPSFYGTFIETEELGYREVVVLPAMTALDYFCDPAPLEHVELQFGEELAPLLRLAPAMKEALLAGKFMPDYRRWKQGRPGWKLELPETEAAEAAMHPSLERWTEALIAEWTRLHPEAERRIRRLAQDYPLVQQRPPSPDLWLDEEDWLVAIGWKTDATPFRTCLQLVEPSGGESWQLRVLLQDRHNKEHLVEWSPDRGAAEAIPAAWEAHLDRVRKDIRRWTQLVPWLDEERATADGGSAPGPGKDGGAAGQEERGDDSGGDAAGTAVPRGLGAVPPKPVRLRTRLTHDEAWRFLAEDSLRLVEAGDTVFLPAWWERVKQLKPRIRARIKSSVGTAQQSKFGLQQMMQFDWRLAIGDLEMTEAEFRELLEQKRRLLHFRGRWIQLDPTTLEEIQRVMKRVQRKKGLTFRDVLEIHLLGGESAAEALGDEERHGPQLAIEVELNEQLRDMIAHLTHSATLPAAPTPSSFVGTLRPYQIEGMSWMLFLRRFGLGGCLADDMGLGKTIQWITYLLSVKEQEAPSSPSLLICPTSVLGNWQKELQRFAPGLKVHLHYGPQRCKGDAFRAAVRDCDLVLTSYTLSYLDEEELGSVEWDSICLDEAQNIKNAYTKQATSIRGFRGFHRFAMTGTPIENRLTELWSIFDFLNPGYLGSLREFNQRFVSAIEKDKDAGKIAQVQQLVRPFLLRRVKKDPSIQLDLPEKNEAKMYVSLTAEQGSLYENYIRDMFDRLDKLSPMERRGLILAALTKLKQLCNHPALLLKEGTAAQTVDRSNKVKRLLEMVGELREEGDRCLIFTQFVETGHMLKHLLERHRGERVQFLHGGTPKAERDEMIARFQDESLSDEDACGIFILSLKAGGVGLNLTAANHVFHFDRWWNPAVENQATDRAFRIGQKRHVQVHKFITLGTLEEKIDELIEQKTSLSEQIVGTGENWITELSTDELRSLLALRSE